MRNFKQHSQHSGENRQLVKVLEKEYGQRNAKIFDGVQRVMRTSLQLMSEGCCIQKVELGNAYPRITIQNNAAARALPSAQKVRRKGFHGWESIQAAGLNGVEIQFIVRGAK